MKKVKVGLLARVGIAIVSGILCGLFFPEWAVRIFLTFNSLFGSFLDFVVPLIILGLVAPGIAELGRGAGKMLAVTLLIAYASTLFSGFLAYFSCDAVYPFLLENVSAEASGLLAGNTQATGVVPFFTLPLPPLFGVMSALVFAFMLGIGLTLIPGQETLKNTLFDFRETLVAK